MTSPISPLSPVSIEDLRGRVREAESLLGIARGLARDELRDPKRCERARDRIVSILREIDALFPGLQDPPPALDPSELIAPSMRRVSSSEVALDNGESDGTDDEAGEGDPDEDEWDLDHAKLAAALDNQELMGNIPEIDREWFRRIARRSIEAEERASLCDRVRVAFDELAQAMKAGLQETSRQLSVALTFEQLKARQQH
jgi:hypothetical protein